MFDIIKQIVEKCRLAIEEATDTSILADIKVRFLGKNGEYTGILRGMKNLSPEERPSFGKLVNEGRAFIEQKIAEKEAQLKAEEQRKKHREKLLERYQNANIGERYINTTLELLAKMGTENVAEAQEYVKNFNPASGKGLHFIGNFGNGKTSIGYALIKKLVNKGFNCLSTSWNELSLRCHYAKSYDTKETIEQILSDVSKFDFVMIDEFCPNCKDEKEIILATELIDRLYRNNKCFLVINNPCDIQAMKQVPRFGKALDRIREQTQKLIFQHESYRK